MSERRARSSSFRPTHHAAERYIERIEGNVTPKVAKERIALIARNARRKRDAPGGATVYGIGGLELVVADGAILTIHRADTRPTPYALDA